MEFPALWMTKMGTTKVETTKLEMTNLDVGGAGRRLAGFLRILWRFGVGRAADKKRLLAVRDSASLGERRFVSVIQFERQRFLIGSSASSITLLAQLPDEWGGEESPGAGRKEHEGGE